ncbi:unnamed protein product [Amoebophrya sp. A120]|nr:unnamed protein product [Amoebophrya sp. A120]|eukprot:GSA120T00016201001.1
MIMSYSRLFVPAALYRRCFVALLLLLYDKNSRNTAYAQTTATDTTTSFSVERYGSIDATGHENTYYQAYQYIGSRILEHGSKKNMRVFRWTQTGDVQDTEILDCAVCPGRKYEALPDANLCMCPTNFVYLVDPTYHVVLELAPNTTYVNWPSQYRVISGIYGRQGYFDGIYEKSLFNGPMGISLGRHGIYIADTNNHAVRFLNYAQAAAERRVMTLAGHPSRPGEQDGPSMYAEFRFPTSLGNYDPDPEIYFPAPNPGNEKIFVLDNHSRVRMLYMDHVITLADGSCRAMTKKMYPVRVIVREVACHDVWSIHKTGSVETALFQPAVQCSGHAGTCAPREHPGYSDKRAKNLLTVEASRPQITGRMRLLQEMFLAQKMKKTNSTRRYLSARSLLGTGRAFDGRDPSLFPFTSSAESVKTSSEDSIFDDPRFNLLAAKTLEDVEPWRFKPSFNAGIEAGRGAVSRQEDSAENSRQQDRMLKQKEMVGGNKQSKTSSTSATETSKASASKRQTQQEDQPTRTPPASKKPKPRKMSSALQFGEESTLVQDIDKKKMRTLQEKATQRQIDRTDGPQSGKKTSAKSTGVLEHWKHMRGWYQWAFGGGRK